MIAREPSRLPRVGSFFIQLCIDRSASIPSLRETLSTCDGFLLPSMDKGSAGAPPAAPGKGLNDLLETIIFHIL